jgi:hypothetical protein
MWHPINTAPKILYHDILVYRPNAKPNAYIPQVGVDYWGRMANGGAAWMRSNEENQPTHWMPLPQPPEKQ